MVLAWWRATVRTVEFSLAIHVHALHSCFSRGALHGADLHLHSFARQRSPVHGVIQAVLVVRVKGAAAKPKKPAAGELVSGATQRVAGSDVYRLAIACDQAITVSLGGLCQFVPVGTIHSWRGLLAYSSPWGKANTYPA